MIIARNTSQPGKVEINFVTITLLLYNRGADLRARRVAVPLAGRADDGRSRVKCLVPARGARRDMVLDEVSAAIPRDAVARNAKNNQPGGVLSPGLS